MSAWRRKTFPLQTLHSILSKVGIRSLPMTPATNLKQMDKMSLLLLVEEKNAGMTELLCYFLQWETPTRKTLSKKQMLYSTYFEHVKWQKKGC